MPTAAPTGPAELADIFRQALADAGLPDREPVFERPRQREHGDWATNVALTLAKPVGRAPRDIAERIKNHLVLPADVDRVVIAGPGFINLHLSHVALEQVVAASVSQGTAWGRATQGDARRVNVEFVSANPTGPLHVGSGRWAAAGDAIASLLEATGWEVHREYYLNDAGNQLDLFGKSVAAVARGEQPPEHGYRGAYITQLAEDLDPEALDGAGQITEAAYRRMLERIKATMSSFGVDFDEWFSERTLHDSGAVDDVVRRLREGGHAYEQDGALFLRTADFGDDKDRVLIRADGRPTYFAADCAYMASKVERGFDVCIYLLGADHHGYVNRLLAIAAAMGLKPGTIEVVIGQLVNLYREGVEIRMSKRTGEMVTFDELIEEVGPDAARYTFLRTSLDVTLAFDIAEVVRQDRENPVYYVQYSHARIAGIMRTATERGVAPGTVDDARLELLTHETEEELIRRISTFPEVVEYSAQERAPHRVARFAEELAEAFHRFYTECQVVGDDEDLTRARYWLCVSTRQTLVNALGLLGVSAPDRM
ncbi:MAG: arginine--tRNA ligase [Nitriliruptorales bacterium]|nr:arginine--tRNA ligase [Nitriliruptorales bacterium]